MEQPLVNLYFIQIGTYSRAGNLTVSHSFAVSSEYPHDRTLAIYRERYRGLGVMATKIETMEVAKEAEKQAGKSEAEIQLEKQVKELEKGIGTSFDYQQDWSDFSLEIRKEYEELVKTRHTYLDKKDEVAKIMRLSLAEKFGAVVKEIVVKGSPDGGSDRYFKCTVCLKGKLY